MTKRQPRIEEPADFDVLYEVWRVIGDETVSITPQGLDKDEAAGFACMCNETAEETGAPRRYEVRVMS